jgi:aryl-alcohol dehydrogenase-like predicted oxidoreductase
MPTAPLGTAGLEVSRLALGTMTFGDESSEEEAVAQLDRFVEAGGTHLDTADVYGEGESERIIGRWLRSRRPTDVVIATKGRFRPPPGSAGASRRSLVRSVDASLERLGVDAIDLYYVHGWDDVVPLHETLDTLTALVRAGKIHHVGWSNVTGWQLGTIMTTARLGGYVEPCVLQPQYNLLDRSIEVEVLPCCRDEGLATAPWSPLGGGWLTGKYRRDERPTGATRLGEDPERGVEAYDRRNTDRTWRVLEEVEEVAAAHDRPMAQVAIAWLLTRPTVATVLLGARTLEQLDQVLGAADLELTAAEVDRLTTVSAPTLPAYPYGMIEEFSGMSHWRDLGVERD